MQLGLSLWRGLAHPDVALTLPSTRRGGQGGICSLDHLVRERNSTWVFQSTSPLQGWGPGTPHLSRHQNPIKPVSMPRAAQGNLQAPNPQTLSTPGRRLSCPNLSFRCSLTCYSWLGQLPDTLTLGPGVRGWDLGVRTCQPACVSADTSPFISVQLR